MPFSRERRAHICRKWHFLESLETPQIRDRLEERDMRVVSERTIQRYLNEGSAEQTREMVHEKMAGEDLRMAESLQRKHDRAREDEKRATRTEPVRRVRPKVKRVPHDARRAIQKPAWEDVEPGDDDWPEWATERDHIIRFTGATTYVGPGEVYPRQGLDGGPQYTSEMSGLNREVDDLNQRTSKRYEQAAYLDQKASILGIDDDSITVEHEGSLDVEHSVPEELIEAVVGAAHHRLDENVSKNREDDENGNGADDDSET